VFHTVSFHVSHENFFSMAAMKKFEGKFETSKPRDQVVTLSTSRVKLL
jgi:hypothetical protein